MTFEIVVCRNPRNDYALLRVPIVFLDGEIVQIHLTVYEVLERAGLDEQEFARARRELLSTGLTLLRSNEISAADLIGIQCSHTVKKMSQLAKLGPNSYACCPQCGYKVSFFYGDKDTFMSEERTFLSDARIGMKCPIHGTFDISAGEFVDAQSK